MGSWALIPIDSRPVREKARREYEKAQRDLEQARAQIEQFDEQDKPRFQQWLSRTFGALITELRETNHRLDTQRALLFEIETEALWSGSSHVRAYERVIKRRENPEPDPSAPPGADAGAGAESEGDDDLDPDEEAFWTSLEEEFEGFFGAEPGKGLGYGNGVKAEQPARRLKELYRALARRLHPDCQEQMTPQKTEWWHRAQAAYEAADADQLLIILTLCEIEEHGNTGKTSISALMQLTREFKASLRALKARLRECRHDPAWNFSGLGDLRPLAQRIERELRGELFVVKQALAAVEAQLESWSQQAAAARRRPRRRGSFSSRR